MKIGKEGFNLKPRLKKPLLHHKKTKRLPSYLQWRQVFSVLNKQEQIAFLFFAVLAIGSIILLAFNFYLGNSQMQPAKGSQYIEGVVGQPSFINPLLAVGDVDKDLTELLFSGLMKYNSKGEIVEDLAEICNIKEEGRVYEFILKENIFWHDKTPLTSDDIVFTIDTIQNPDFKNPERANWLGVEIEKISDRIIRFRLKESYAPFLERTTLKIIPKHIWQDISPQNLTLAVQYNLQPIGSGPYKFKEIKQNGLANIESIVLEANPDYFGQIPWISKFIFRFFENEKDLIKAANSNEINGLSPLNPKDRELIKGKRFDIYRASLPRYFAVFFEEEMPNETATAFAQGEIRKALNYATDKDEILQTVLDGEGKVVHSPILPEIYGFGTPSISYPFSLEKAGEYLEKAGLLKQEDGKFLKPPKGFQGKFVSDLERGDENEEVEALQECLALDDKVYPEGKITGYFGPATEKAVIRFQEKYKEEILDPWGFSKGTGTVARSTKAQLNKICHKPETEALPLSIVLTTPDQPFLVETANLLKEQWGKLGIEVNVETAETSELTQNFIKPRSYEALIFGQVLGGIPDLFPFWHSLWKKDPGLNLTFFGDKAADKLLEEARKSSDPDIRTENYQAFQDILLEEAPAIFLYSPDYVYLSSKTVDGIEIETITSPSKRFSGVENWFIETKRTWK